MERGDDCRKCFATGTVAKVHLEEPSCKLDALDDVLEDLGGQPVVVFAQSRQLIDLASARLARRKVEHAMVVGGQDEEERDEGVRRFQAGEIPVMLATIGAGGEGLTLNRADVSVFLNRSWSKTKDDQAEERTWDPESQVEIIDIIAEDTVEERVFEALEEKAGVIEEVVRDEETMRRVLGGEAA